MVVEKDKFFIEQEPYWDTTCFLVIELTHSSKTLFSWLLFSICIINVNKKFSTTIKYFMVDRLRPSL